MTIATKTWARLEDGVVAELRGFPAELAAGTDLPDIWAHDVTDIAGVAVGWVLSGGVLVPPAPSKSDLLAYAVAKQIALRDGGIKVNVGTEAAPNVVDVASDVNGRDLVAGNVQYIGLCSQAGQPAPTFNWKNDPIGGAPGTKTVMTAAQMMSVGLTLRAFIQATYDALDVCDTAVVDDSVKTEADVDAGSFWPATAY